MREDNRGASRMTLPAEWFGPSASEYSTVPWECHLDDQDLKVLAGEIYGPTGTALKHLKYCAECWARLYDRAIRWPYGRQISQQTLYEGQIELRSRIVAVIHPCVGDTRMDRVGYVYRDSLLSYRDPTETEVASTDGELRSKLWAVRLKLRMENDGALRLHAFGGGNPLPLAGVAITLDGGKWEAVTNAGGYAFVGGLKPDRYDVLVEWRNAGLGPCDEMFGWDQE